MKKETTIEDINLASQFNITKYISHCAKNSIPLDKNFFNSIDFEEVSSVEIQHYSKEHGSIQYKVEDTLAQNIMDYLPLSYYKELVTSEWLTYTKKENSNLVGKFIYSKNIDLLEYLHSIGLEKSLVDQKFSHTFSMIFLKPLLDVNSNLSRSSNNSEFSSDFVSRYHSLIKKTHDEFKYFGLLSYSNPKEPENKLIYNKNSKWVTSYLSRVSSYSSSNTEIKKINELFHTLSKVDKFLPIFEDVFEQITKKYKSLDEIKDIFGLGNKNTNQNDSTQDILANCFLNKNYNIASFIINALGVSKEQCLKSFDSNIEKSFNNLNNRESTDFKSLLHQHFNDEYNIVKDKFFSSLETKFFPFFIFGNSISLQQKVLDNKEKIFSQPIFNVKETNINHFLYLAKCMDSYTKHYENSGFNWKNSDRDFNFLSTIVAHISNNHSELYKNIDLKNISTKEWNLINSNIIKIVQSGKTINPNQTNQANIQLWFNQFQLDQQLETNNIKVKKIKI